MNYQKIAVRERKNKVESSTKDSLLDELLALKNIISKEKQEEFLNPSRKYFISPYAFLDMEKAKKRIFEAIEKKQKILIWGDFDCDGVTSTAILYKTLKKLEADVIEFIPDRLHDGHGLNSKELIKFISKEKVKLVITVDCGISNNSEINLLKGFNIDTIITDHHSTDGDIPSAYAIINPQVQGAIEEETTVEDITSLCANSGSAVAYKLAMALLEDIEDNKLKDELLIIASLGIVADVVPLIGENRSMVSVCLELLNSKKEESFKPVYKLLKKHIQNDITSYDIAFILAPRINAVGRLANASLSFEFLTTEDDTKLDIIIEKLDNYNKIRQSKCQETYDEVKEYLLKHKEESKNPAIILINPDWHVGIIGIVASKIVEEFSKPCFLMTTDDNNFARCSIRSNESINVYEILKENEELFAGFGGHKLAGGCSFDLSKISFEKVKESLLNTISSDMEEIKENIFYADTEITPDDINLNILDTINRLEPFGQDNEMPVFAMFDVILDEIKVIGKEQNHLSLTFSKNGQKFKAVKWQENTLDIPQGTKCDIAFSLKLNIFNDIKNVQVELLDIYSDCLNLSEKTFKIFDHRKKTGILEQVAQYLKKEGLDIVIWAKNQKTKESLLKYDSITKNIIQEPEKHSGLMFFDYPATKEDLDEILNSVKPEKIHFMNYKIDENIENYIKQINGMLKYCNNKLDGKIDILRMARALNVSENFISISLEILEELSSIKIIDTDKIEYIQSFNYDDFKSASMFEVLKEEFENIVEFKKTLLETSVDELENLIKI